MGLVAENGLRQIFVEIKNRMERVSKSALLETSNENFTLVENDGINSGVAVNGRTVFVTGTVKCISPASTFVEVAHGLPGSCFSSGAVSVFENGAPDTPITILMQSDKMSIAGGASNAMYKFGFSYISDPS